MAAPIIPQPIYANQGGGGSGGPGDFLQQLLLTVASASPQLISQHLARKDQERRDMALGAAALPAIQQLGAAAAADPSLAALGAAVNAFMASPDAKVMQLAAPAFLEQAQGTMGALQERNESQARTGLLGEQTNLAAAQGELTAEQASTERDLRGPRVREAAATASIQEIEAAWRERLLQAQLARENAIAAANWREAERIDADDALKRIELAAQLEAYERDAFNAAVETNAAFGPAAARTAAALSVYGTPRQPTLEEIRADAQARANGAEPNLFANIRQGYVERMRSAGYGASMPDEVLSRFIDQLDIALLNADGNPQVAMDAILKSNQLMPDELPVAANYLSAVTAQPVRMELAPKVTLTERLKAFLGGVGKGAAAIDGGGSALNMRKRQTPSSLLESLGNPAPSSAATNYMNLSPAELEAQLRRSAGGAQQRFLRPPQR